MATYRSKRAVLGILMALAAPVGWLIIRWLQGSSPRTEVTAEIGLYLYMLIGTATAFAAFGFALGSWEDRLRAANARLGEEALTDALTRLKNGRYFHARLEEEFLDRARASEPLAVVVLDLDQFNPRR
jgi:predicted signal transduction protein with EAL and GGDEF domain